MALLALVPWTFFALAALIDAVRDWRFSVQQPAGQEDFRTYLSLWFLLPIVFFSLSHSKLPGYILPGIPAATILLADFIRRREQEQIKPPMWMVALHALLSSAMLIAAFVVPFKLLKLPTSRTVIIVAVSLAVATILMFVLSLQSQGYRVLRFTTLVPVVIAFSLILRGTAPLISYCNPSGRWKRRSREPRLAAFPTSLCATCLRELSMGWRFIAIILSPITSAAKFLPAITSWSPRKEARRIWNTGFQDAA